MDKQKKKVYSWENVCVAPRDKSVVLFNNIQPIVNYIWQEEGLNFPPTVVRLGEHSPYAAMGDRLEVHFKSQTETWVILHELSHSMTSLCDGRSNQHGSLFMGIYCKLLNKYLGFDAADSARNFGLMVQENAEPVFN
jgi:hypothetical protein